MFSARYSSGSSALAPAYSPSLATSFAWCSAKLSEMYLRKMSPRTTCLYSAASMLLRSLSAASQSLASKPMLAELLEDEFLDFPRAIREATLVESFSDWERKRQRNLVKSVIAWSMGKSCSNHLSC